MVHISISDLIVDETSSPMDCLDLPIRESSMLLGGQAMRPVSNFDPPSHDDVDVGQPPIIYCPIIPLPLGRRFVGPPVAPSESKP